LTTIRIGILGAGAMGTAHAAAYVGIAEADVVGVFSRGPARAPSAASLCKARPFSDANVLIASADAIDVCLPSAIHHTFVVPALNAGKHVFCETPLALALDEARQMRDAARRADRLLQVGLLMRSLGAYEHIKAVVSSGEHGRLLSVATWRLGSYLHPHAPDHKAHYGDPSTELMTFDFDFVQWLWGRPSRVTAAAAGGARGGAGEISALLEYDDGRSATVLASGIMPSGFPFSVGFRVVFECGAFEYGLVIEAGEFRATFVRYPEKGSPEQVSLPDRNPYEQELRLFANCIVGKADPTLLVPERAREALTLSIATQQSLREHRGIDPRSIR